MDGLAYSAPAISYSCKMFMKSTTNCQLYITILIFKGKAWAYPNLST
jgi:hypothetical protein